MGRSNSVTKKVTKKQHKKKTQKKPNPILKMNHEMETMPKTIMMTMML